MSNLVFNLNIPLDDEGYIEMECDYCKNRFMLHKDVFQNDNYLHFFCPICGLPNDVNTFYCPEVLEKAQQIAANQVLNKIDKMLSSTFRKTNSRKNLISLSVKVPKTEKPRDIYEYSKIYEKAKKNCCDVFVKVTSFDKLFGTYCPICGVQEDE